MCTLSVQLAIRDFLISHHYIQFPRNPAEPLLVLSRYIPYLPKLFQTWFLLLATKNVLVSMKTMPRVSENTKKKRPATSSWGPRIGDGACVRKTLPGEGDT